MRPFAAQDGHHIRCGAEFLPMSCDDQSGQLRAMDML